LSLDMPMAITYRRQQYSSTSYVFKEVNTSGIIHI
jgi:hypothetical protein